MSRHRSRTNAPRVAAIVAEARRRLGALADPAVKAGGERYFKGVIPFVGVSAPVVRGLARDLLAEQRAVATETLIDAALALLCGAHMEEKQLGILMLERLGRRWPATLLDDIDRIFDRAVNNWATCDAIAGRIVHPLLQRDPAVARRMARWSRARHPWRQRAAAVAFVKSARSGVHTATILAICDRLARRDDRFVQLGMGWVLRELSLADRAGVVAFLARHRATIRREALRYAIEKLNAT
ncbi:MAG TPA: DNA alkylation repair protein, partial [Gemmatimonadaceae bacterium]|nr:DNA alkylation repair protein [Gemmatimonadaceae bacterium]